MQVFKNEGVKSSRLIRTLCFAGEYLAEASRKKEDTEEKCLIFGRDNTFLSRKKLSKIAWKHEKISEEGGGLGGQRLPSGSTHDL